MRDIINIKIILRNIKDSTKENIIIAAIKRDVKEVKLKSEDNNNIILQFHGLKVPPTIKER